MSQQSSAPTPRATRPLTLTPTNPAYPVERGASDSAVLRAIPGARMRAKVREMRAAVTRMSADQQQQAVMADAAIPPLAPRGMGVAAPPTVPLGQPTPRAVPRFTPGEAISHPRSNQIGKVAAPPRPWSTGLLWPVCWLRRDGRGGLCWTPWYTWVWQEELVSIQ